MFCLLFYEIKLILLNETCLDCNKNQIVSDRIIYELYFDLTIFYVISIDRYQMVKLNKIRLKRMQNLIP